MSQTSRLSIVVDTSNAKQRLADFTKQLNDVTRAATNMAEKVEKSLSAKGSQGASSQISGLTRETNLLGTAAQQAALMQDRLTTSAAKTATAQANATKAAANAATAQNRQAASANSVTISNNSLAQSEFALERAMNKTIATETRLQIIQNSLAGSALRLGTAQQNAAISATLGQDKLAASTHRVAAAASAANLASSKFVISQHNEATAALRTTTQLSRLATEQQRTAAATSAAAGAATRAQINLNGLAASAVRVQREEAKLQAELLRTNALADRQAAAAARAAAGLNGMGNAADRANHASRGLHGSMNKLYTVLNSGLVAVTGLGFIKTAAEMQNLNNQIRLVTDSEHEYLIMKQLAGKIADENFADINSTISLYQKSVRALTNLGKSQADSIKFTEAVSLAMRTGGRSAGENAAAILQLGQAMGAGVVMGDEFRSISENAPVLLKLVAKEMGVLQGDLKKLSADGKITAEIMYNAMTKNMAELEELAKKMPLTMGQAFVVAKNNYKKYTDELMNSTGGVSDKISGMLVKISANFDTIAKVGMAGMVLGLVSIIAHLATATKAMALFNFVTSSNKLILIASGFLLVNSAIFGTNEVLTISGIMLGDFFDGMATMLKDGETWWMDFSNTVAVAMGITVKEVAEANDKNSKNFLGFYNRTEEGFAGVVQGISTAAFSITNIFSTTLTVIDNYILNTQSLIEGLADSIYNVVQKAKGFIGLQDNSSAKTPYANRDTNFFSVYGDSFAEGQDAIRDYARSLNQRKDPPKPFGVYDPDAPLKQNMVNQNFFSVDMTKFMQKGVGASVFARTTKSPTREENPLLYNPQASRFPVDPQAALAYETEKIRKQEEERLKILEEQNEEIKKQNKGLSERLVGISGDTGIGTAHLHAQLRDKNRALTAGELSRLQAGGKAITDYPMTSGFGKRNTGIAGASTYHRGTDYDIPKNTPITTTAAVDSVRTWYDSKGGGYVSSIDFADGLKIDLLHQMPSVMGVEKGASTGNSQVDGLVSKMQSEAEKQREKEAQEAEKRFQARLKLDKEYATKRELISLQLNEKLIEIRDAGYDEETAVKRGDQAVAEANREMAVYEETLKRRVDALDDFHQTERYKLQQERDNSIFDALHNQDLLQAGNEQYLKYEIEAANRLYKHKESLLNLSQEEEALGLFEYASTDRRMFEEGWRLKIARAKLATDELKDIRIKAYEAEYAKDQELFNLNEKKKLLSLREGGMGAGEYMLANQRLNIQGINADSSLTPEEKRLEANAARQPLNDALTGIMSDINPQSENERIEQEHRERLEILDAYESQYTSLVGVQSAERIAIEKSYQDAKRDLMINKGGETLSDLTMLSRAFLGEQSSIYKGLFALEKAYTLASVLIKNQEAISKAWASAPFPYNLGAVASTVAGTAGIASAVAGIVPQGFEKGGYTGSMGTKDIAGVVHGQEYVFDAQSTKRIGVDNLNAMRSGKSVGGGDVNISVNVDAKGNAQVSGDNERMGRDMANGIKAVVMETLRKEKRQGGMLYA